MVENFKVVFSVVFDAGFLVQMLAIAAAGVIVMTPQEFERKLQKQKILKSVCRIVFLTLFILALEAVFFALFWLEPMQPFRGLNFSLPVLVGFSLYAALFCKFRRPEKWTIVILMFSTVVVMMEWSAPYGMPWLLEETKVNSAVIKLISDVLIILFAVFIRHFSVTRYHFTTIDAILNCSESALVAAAGMAHEALSSDWDRNVSMEIRIFVTVLFVMLYVINILTYIFSYLISRNRQQLLEKELIQQKQSAELEMAQLTADSLTELREIRHDIKNQYLYMKTLLEKERYEDLNDYFEKFTGKISSQLFRYIDCGNKGISAVINMERIKAERMKIQMNVNVVVPETLPFETVDVCSMMTNILDNALEECERIGSAKSVNVIMNTQGNDYLYFCVVNPTEDTKSGKVSKLPTKKKNRSGHGLGMSIVNKIAEKYDGYYNCHIENGEFIAEVLLNIKGDKNE